MEALSVFDDVFVAELPVCSCSFFEAKSDILFLSPFYEKAELQSLLPFLFDFL
jgi:hypothetical protein